MAEPKPLLRDRPDWSESPCWVAGVDRRGKGFWIKLDDFQDKICYPPKPEPSAPQRKKGK